jgi:hypothetical protein
MFAVEGPDEVEVRVDFIPAGDMESFLVAPGRAGQRRRPD